MESHPVGGFSVASGTGVAGLHPVEEKHTSRAIYHDVLVMILHDPGKAEHGSNPKTGCSNTGGWMVERLSTAEAWELSKRSFQCKTDRGGGVELFQLNFIHTSSAILSDSLHIGRKHAVQERARVTTLAGSGEERRIRIFFVIWNEKKELYYY